MCAVIVYGCDCRGTPDTRVVWYKDGKRFEEDHKRKIVMNVHEDKITSSLVILDTQETDTGNYTVRYTL